MLYEDRKKLFESLISEVFKIKKAQHQIFLLFGNIFDVLGLCFEQHPTMM